MVATLSQLIDMIMVGWIHTQAMAAVGLSSPPLWLLMAIFLGLGTGAGAVVARYAGAGDWERVEEATRKTVLLAAVLASLAGWALFRWAEPFVIWMQAEPDVVPLAAEFLQAMAPGIGAVAWALMATAAMRAGGDTRTPAIISAAVILLNVAGNYLLIQGALGLPALGLLGVGIATSAARCLGLLALVAVLFLRRGDTVRIDWQRLFGLDPRALAATLARWRESLAGVTSGITWRSLRIGLPAAVERSSSLVAMAIYTKQVAGLGTQAVAAHHLTLTADSFVYLVSMGLASAAAALVGQELGAGASRRAALFGGAALRVGALVGAGFASLFLLFPGAYLHLFTRDPAVLELGIGALRIAAVAELPMAITVVLMGALQGAGERGYPLFATLTGAWAIRLTLTFLLVPVLGLAGAWLAAGVDWSLRMLLVWWRYRSGAWQHHAV